MSNIRAFRKPYFIVLGVIPIAASIIIFIYTLASRPVTGAPIGATVISLLCYFIWLSAWHSKVSITEDDTIVDNLIIRHIIPLEKLEKFGVEYGLYVQLKDGTRVSSFTYGGSILGNLNRYRYTQKICAQMEDERLKNSRHPDVLTATGRDYRRTINIPIVPLIVIAVPLEIAGLIHVVLT